MEQVYVCVGMKDGALDFKFVGVVVKGVNGGACAFKPIAFSLCVVGFMSNGTLQQSCVCVCLILLSVFVCVCGVVCV